MSYNGSGVYTLPGAQLINGEIVSATENNTLRNDMATAFNTAWTRDGQAPATGNIPMGTHKFTGMAAGTENGDSVRYEQVTSAVAITGGTINGVTIGGTAAGDATFDSVTVNTGFTSGFPVDGIVESTTGGFKFPDGTIQITSASSPQSWSSFTSSGSYTVPSGVTSIRAYAIGKGGNGQVSGYGGGGGGCAFGDIAVSPGNTVTITISSGTATLSIGGTAYLVAYPGDNGSAGGAGGTATKDASVTNGGSYTGGAGGASTGGGGSAASPLGNGYAGGSTIGGGGGIGGAGDSAGGGGGAGGSGGLSGGGSGGSGYYSGGLGRSAYNAFLDPLLAGVNGCGGTYSSNPDGTYGNAGTSGGIGGGGGLGEESASGKSAYGGTGGAFGGGGAGYANGTSASGTGGAGGFLGGGGSGYGTSSGIGGSGGMGGGGGSGSSSAGSGGGAIVLIYA